MTVGLVRQRSLITESSVQLAAGRHHGVAILGSVTRIPLVGWHVAGWSGMLVTTLAKFGPSSIITVIALGLWERFKDRPWRGIVQAGIFPMTVGLVAASAR